MKTCPICHQQYKGLPWSVSVNDLLKSKIVDKNYIENLRQKGLIDRYKSIDVCKSCDREMRSSFVESEVRSNGFPQKIADFFSNEDSNKVIHAHSKAFSIQPPVIILFLSGIFLALLDRFDIFTYSELIGIITILFPIMYFLVWLLSRCFDSDTFIGKRGVITEVEIYGRIGNVGYVYPHHEWSQIKKYSIRNDRYRLYVNKYNLLNTTFFIDLFVRKDSERGRIIYDNLRKHNIPQHAKK